MKKVIVNFLILSSICLISCEDVDPCEANPQLCVQEQYEEDLVKIEEFIAENNLEPTKHESGLHYYANNPGLADSVSPRQFVSVDYIGKLLDGTIFDTSVDSVAKANGIYDENRSYTPIYFQVGVGNVISGWDLGLTFFEKGGDGYLIIPSYLAYRNKEQGTIPANSVLYFEINLIDVKY